MNKYQFISLPDPTNKQFERSKVIFEFEATSLKEILPEFENFLRGCGFIIEHDSLQIIKDE